MHTTTRSSAPLQLIVAKQVEHGQPENSQLKNDKPAVVLGPLAPDQAAKVQFTHEKSMYEHSTSTSEAPLSQQVPGT